MPDLFRRDRHDHQDCEFQMVGANGVAVDDPARLFVFEDNAIDPDALPYDPAALLSRRIEPLAERRDWHPSYNGDAATAARSRFRRGRGRGPGEAPHDRSASRRDCRRQLHGRLHRHAYGALDPALFTSRSTVSLAARR
jgi:hypothetical protein